MNLLNTVEKVLREDVRSRSSDKCLFVHLMQEAGMNLSREQIEIFKDMPSLESARRTRQKLQEQGKYEANPEVKKERRHKSMVMQQTIPGAKAERVDKTLNYRVLPWGQG